MKVCKTCKQEKSYSEFYPHKKSADGYAYNCKPCARKLSSDYKKANRDKVKAYKREYYHRKPEYQRQKTKERRERIGPERQAQLREFLASHSCLDCDEADPRVLEFDHVKGDKKANISQMVNWCKPWEEILEEIGKCEVVCRNCHRRRTAKRVNNYRHRFDEDVREV